MNKHTYYRIVLRLASPLSLGSGKNELSDHDCVRHKNGDPYIPASSIAGVFRHCLDGNEALQNEIFGSITGKRIQSSVIFYDAELTGSGFSSIRDSVKLKDKVGVDGAKFDMEIIETGAKFVTFIEIEKHNCGKLGYVEELLAALRNGLLRFGSKTSRGYGMVEIVSLKKIGFDLSTDLDKWLNFNMFDKEAWSDAGEFECTGSSEKTIMINITLRQNGAVSIREYTTDAAEEGGPSPDHKHISLHCTDDSPVIPGTSWAGAFRERYSQFAGDEAADKLFGFVRKNEDNKTVTQRSRIIFSESEISGSEMKNVTRNSIDRFSAKTKDSALYTERTCYNGKTELTVIVPADISEKEKMCLSAVIYDLHCGYLSVGGLTSVGRGMFTVEQIKLNGIDRTDRLVPEKLAEIWR